MRPILLQGHTRAITQIKYNSDGDLLFTCSKDPVTNVWYSINGERLGTFEHKGAVWCVDCTFDSTRVVTGTGSNTLNLWDLQSGELISELRTDTSVRTVNFSTCGNLIFFTTDAQMRQPWQIVVIDVRCPSHFDGTDCFLRLNDDGLEKPTAALFGPTKESLITGHEKGSLVIWDLRSNPKKLHENKTAHRNDINDMQYSADYTMFITASKDCTAKLFDSANLKHLKTYKTGLPVNSAAISPIRDHVVLGGGQEAISVTTTVQQAGQFDSKFHHLIFEEEFARLKGHFGPINSLAFHPSGRSFATGGEDGFVRLQSFDQHYFEIPTEM